MKDCKKNRLSRYVLAALTVGMFSMVPVAYALPVQDTTHTNTSGTGISTVASQMNITGSADNNVMNWQTFSIANGETVQFDAKNYLNLVRGTFKSEINGALNGTGNIYLINPNGILFGSTAQVNVGNLVASTRAITDADQTTFLAGNNPITTNTTSTAAGDIINLGKLQTASVLLEGNNITIQNAADITSDGSTPLTSTVTAKAAGIITVGHKVTETTTRSFTINGTATDKTVHDYANDTYAGSGYTTSKLDGATANVTKEYMLVENVYDLQNMDAKLSGIYMLSGDINASETRSWNTEAGFSPVANGYDGFTGTFDGANHTITGLYINRPATEYRVGLFGYSTGTIQNVGLVGGSITGKDGVGGVVGWNSSGTITNAYNTGAVSGNESVGGVVGQNSSGTITNAYNTGAVSGNEYVGGVAGQNYTDYGTITNVYNTGAVSGNESVGGVVGLDYSSSPITNALWAKDLEYTPTKGVKPTQALGNLADTDTVKGETVANMKKAATYSNWTGTNAVSSIGGAGTAWRIYEGNTTPLLTSFFKGVVTVTGLDNQTVTYNGTIQKADLSGATYSPSNIDASHILAGGDRNVGTYSAIYSDQQGYDLVNTNTLTITPKTLTATLTGNVFTKIYDGGTDVKQAMGNNYSFATGDVESGDTVSLTGTGTYADKNVGNNKTVTFSGITLTGADAGNYTIATTLSGSVGQITKKELTATLTGTNSISKVYDGDNKVTAALTQGTNYQFTGMVANDVLGLTGTGTYTDNKNVGDGKAVSFTGLSLTGADAGNYTIAATLSGNVGQITKKELTAALTGTNSISKVYDGDNKVTAALTQGTNYQFTGMVANDVLGLTGTGTYTDNKNVGNGKAVSFTGLSLTGADAGNYNFTTTSLSDTVGQITKKELTAALTGTNSISKVYDGDNKVTAALTQGTNYQFTGMVEGDTLSLTGTGTYTDNKNAGGDKPVSFTGLSLTGTDAGNYNLTTTSLSDNVGQITKKDLTAALTGTNSVSKVYDGYNTVTAALTQGTNYQFTGMVDGDTLSLTGTGTYTDDKNVGNGKPVSFTGLNFTGTDAGNYNLTTTELSGNVGQITKKDITASLNALSDVYVFTKTYDGGTDVKQALGNNYSFATGDIESVDAGKVSLTAGTGAYTDKNAGDTKKVTFGGLVLGGDEAGNYNLTTTSLTGNVGQITPKALTATLTGDNVFTKVYDGTTTVSQALGTNYALDGIVADSDKVSLTAGSGAYNDKNAGDNKTITFSGLTLTGTGAGNYTIASTLSGAVGQITRRTITGTLASGYSFDKVYDGTTTATLGSGYTLDGVAAGDKVPLTAAKGFYDSSAVGDRTVTFSGFSINDGNYLLSMADSLSGTGKITSGSQDHNYSDALTGVSSFFGANPSDGYTIFGGAPEDYVPRAVTKNNGQSYQVGVSQVTQTWYNGPATITIINGGITLPKDILLGSTYDTRTVVIKGGNSYEI